MERQQFSGINIDKKYKVLNAIGEGSFGCVYNCIEINSKQTYVVKMLPCHKTKEKEYLHEIKILKSINGVQGTPKMIDRGYALVQKVWHYFIVFEKLDRTLLDVIMADGKLSLSETINLGLEILSILEQLHRVGIYHGDIKPNNIMQSDGRYYLIDFGKADFIQEHDKYMKFNHNEWFVSVNAFRGHTLTKRDDIIQLIYCLVYALDEYETILIEAKDESQIARFKLKATAAQFCKGKFTQFLTPILEEAYSYKYEQIPNYERLRQLLTEIEDTDEGTVQTIYNAEWNSNQSVMISHKNKLTVPKKYIKILLKAQKQS